jgi:hypothetical protein
LGFLLRVPGGSFLSLRSLPWRRRVLVTAATSVRRSDRLRSVADSARLDVHGRFDPFSGVQGTSGLRIRAGQPGHASKCSASRIRRRSHEHPTELYAIGGQMKDRLRSRLTPVVIDRIPRGTHDRADANRTLPEAVRPLSAAKQLAARVTGRPMTCLHIGGSP